MVERSNPAKANFFYRFRYEKGSQDELIRPHTTEITSNGRRKLSKNRAVENNQMVIQDIDYSNFQSERPNTINM